MFTSKNSFITNPTGGCLQWTNTGGMLEIRTKEDYSNSKVSIFCSKVQQTQLLSLDTEGYQGKLALTIFGALDGTVITVPGTMKIPGVLQDLIDSPNIIKIGSALENEDCNLVSNPLY